MVSWVNPNIAILKFLTPEVEKLGSVAKRIILIELELGR